MSDVGDNLKASNANWKFGGDVVDNFDEHVRKSVPFYSEGHQLICELSDYFIKPDSVCYEIGCSTGTLTRKIAEHNAAKPEARFVGLDIEPDMIAAAERNSLDKGINVEFVCDDVLEAELAPADLIIAYYTIQFVRPSQRQILIDKLYNSLQWGGGLLLFEKVRGPDARFQDMLSRLYDEYKLRQGYGPEEILSKTRSLKGVLEPFSTQGNLDLLSRAGFGDIMSIMKYVCFEGFVAIK